MRANADADMSFDEKISLHKDSPTELTELIVTPYKLAGETLRSIG